MSEIDTLLDSGITFIPVVVGFMIRDHKVLLGLRKKVSLGLGHNLFTGIGGKIGDRPEIQSETPDQALIREFQEEIKVTPKKFEKIGEVGFIFPHKSQWTQGGNVYRILSWDGEPTETEAMKPVWFPFDNLPRDQMWDDNSYWLPQILKGSPIRMIFLLGKDNNVKEYQNI